MQKKTREENLIGLMAFNREALGQAESLDSSDRVVLDMDSGESPVHGEQEGSAYNGHFESVSRAGEACDARARGPNREFRIT